MADAVDRGVQFIGRRNALRPHVVGQRREPHGPRDRAAHLAGEDEQVGLLVLDLGAEPCPQCRDQHVAHGDLPDAVDVDVGDFVTRVAGLDVDDRAGA